MTRKRPRGRLWTLEALSRDVTYRLEFNEAVQRWDLYDPLGALVQTREALGGGRTQPGRPAAP